MNKIQLRLTIYHLRESGANPAELKRLEAIDDTLRGIERQCNRAVLSNAKAANEALATLAHIRDMDTDVCAYVGTVSEEGAA